MFVFVLCASLIAGCLASFPNLHFHDGTCPELKSSTGFEPSQIFGEWFVIAHTEQGHVDSGCCKCVKVNFMQGTSPSFLSERKAMKFNGDQVITKSKFDFVNDKYFYFVQENDEYKPTNMQTVFNYNHDDGYLVVYGCVAKDNKYAHVALIMSKNQSATKPAFATSYLESTGLTQFHDVSHENC